MKLFRGLEQTDFQDILRAVGLFLDERGCQEFRIVAHEDGLIVQLLPLHHGQTTAYRYQTFLLTDEDLQALLRKSYQRRSTGPLREPRMIGV